jgi:chemotaxis protein methyltransferase CheR
MLTSNFDSAVKTKLQNAQSQLPEDFRHNRRDLAHNTPVMSDREFALLSNFINRHTGITLPPAKKNMLVARLLKRLKELHLSSFLDYYNYISSPEGYQSEFANAIDMVSTNETKFFREPGHFKFLSEVALPKLANQKRRKVNVWSAGCSSGEEPYTIAMALAEFGQANGGIEFSIFATDISNRMLEKGKGAIYTESDIQSVPNTWPKKYLMRGTGSRKGYHRVVPELRNKVIFQHLNLMDGSFPFRAPMDFIFCRNVMIYFEAKARAGLVQKFYNHLVEGGHLFIGHSETLHGMETEFKIVVPTVYQKV